MSDNLIERVFNYATDIVAGNIIACKKEIRACQRFLNDVDRLADDEYQYYFDTNELTDFYNWSKMFRHKEGILAGEPIELNDWQLFVCANIFCWKRKDNGYRKYKRAFIQVARKNGKSFLLSLIISYTAFLSSEKEQIFVAGTKKEQSKIVYNQILDQINGCKFLKNKYKTSYGRITVNNNDSVIKPLSKEDGKKGDGLFPSLAVLDELHLHETSEMYDVLLSGMIGRKNPLIVAITTAGLNLNSFGYQEYQYVSKVIDPENTAVENDEYFVMICELDPDDDISDTSLYRKANPVVTTFPEGIEDLQSRLKVAHVYEEKMTEFMTKHLNIWVQAQADSYMNLSKWNECAVEQLPDLQGKEVYIGVDLSATIDLTSVAFVVPVEDKKFAVLGHSFAPEETLTQKQQSDKVPYDLWERKGFLTATEGSVVDYNYVQRYIERMIEHYNWNVKMVCYDPWNAAQFANNMQDAGLVTVEVRQGMVTLAPTTKTFKEHVYQQKIIHDSNPVVNWAMGNAQTKQDDQGNCMLSKKLSTQRIDPVAAIMTAFAHAQYHYQHGDINDMLTDEFLNKMGW